MMLQRRWEKLQYFVSKNLLPHALDPHHERILNESKIHEAQVAKTVCVSEVTTLLDRIRNQYEILKNHRPSDDVTLLLFSKDVWVAEQGVPDNTWTTEIVTLVIENKFPGSYTHEMKKITNIVKTTKQFLIENTEKPVFNIELCHRIHTMLMQDILPENDVGKLRTMRLAASDGSSYEEPGLVERRLSALLTFTQLKINEICAVEGRDFDQFLNQIILGSLFVEEFLGIHPYRNGNGRTVRILFSLIVYYGLDPAGRWPVSFYAYVPVRYHATRREFYIETLEMSRRCGVPAAMVRYLLEGINMYFFDIITSTI